ncbi:MAG: chloramphenicol phosphotransferase [Rhizobiaceae bacterium]|nr:chloramphenicol phosphotransferase [Rhizobiaceae bacterium]
MANQKDAIARIIFLNGTSSSGKTRVAGELRKLLPDTFCYFASDQLASTGFRAVKTTPDERNRFFDGFHKSIAAFAFAGNDMIVEHIIEEQLWSEELRALLDPFDVFRVAIHAPLDILQEREIQRGDRTIGEAEYHLRTHDFCHYDFEVRNTATPTDTAHAIHQAWLAR